MEEQHQIIVVDSQEALKQWGGARPGAGRPHEHVEYVIVEVVDFYGDEDSLIIGPVSWKGASREAHKVAAHHVGEQAQSVKIVKRFCCSHRESTLVETIK